MKLQFQEINPRRIVNTHKHVDGPWFWDKYSAHPYVGCRSGCMFCYLRGSHYLGQHDPETFDSLIRVKINTVDLLESELPHLKPDIINLGDWQQPAEDRYQLSRAMLEVLSKFEFPLIIVERSPLVVRDLDLIYQINQKSHATVIFSISSLDPKHKAAFESRSPGVRRRLEAMGRLADAGVEVGTALMPVIPFAGDDEDSLDTLIQVTKDHGGSFVLAGGLSMSGTQVHYTLEAARKLDPDISDRIKDFFQLEQSGKISYNPPRSYTIRLGRTVRRLCAKHGITDRLVRYIPDHVLAVNKWVAEQLFNKTYDMELENANPYQIWAYRKAAWLIDELEENIANLYYSGGESRLQELPGIGKGISSQIAGWIRIFERKTSWKKSIH